MGVAYATRRNWWRAHAHAGPAQNLDLFRPSANLINLKSDVLHRHARAIRSHASQSFRPPSNPLINPFTGFAKSPSTLFTFSSATAFKSGRKTGSAHVPCMVKGMGVFPAIASSPEV